MSLLQRLARKFCGHKESEASKCQHQVWGLSAPMPAPFADSEPAPKIVQVHPIAANEEVAMLLQKYKEKRQSLKDEVREELAQEFNERATAQLKTMEATLAIRDRMIQHYVTFITEVLAREDAPTQSILSSD